MTGLLRMTEPGGGLLRTTTRPPTAGTRATSPAIAAARGLAGPVAPYFVDADAAPATRRGLAASAA